MPNHQWKQAERRLARLFGTERRALSGSNSKSGGQDDGMHERIYLENKYGKQTKRFWALYLDTQRKAKSEGRVPVVGLQAPHTAGTLLVFHQYDFDEIYREYQRARGMHVVLQPLSSPPKKNKPAPRKPLKLK